MKRWMRWVIVLIGMPYLGACGGPPTSPSAVPSIIAVSSAIPPSSSPSASPITPTAGPTISAVTPDDSNTGAAKVAVLIVDSFKDITIESNNTEAKNCIVQPGGQSARPDHFTAGGVGDGFLHGETVLGEAAFTIQSTLRGTPALTTTGDGYFNKPLPWIPIVAEWKTDDGIIVLMGVDTDDFTTELAAKRITTTTKLLRENKGIDRMVVNMSFAIIPCGDVTIDRGEYEKTIAQHQNFLALKAVVESVGGDVAIAKDMINQKPLNSVTAQARLEAAYSPIVEGFNIKSDVNINEKADTWVQGVLFDSGQTTDTLYIELQKLQPPPIMIAAAGNSQARFPFAPAMWKNVVSVSACDAPPCGDGDIRPDAVFPSRSYSNVGEVRMGGETIYSPALLRGLNISQDQIDQFAQSLGQTVYNTQQLDGTSYAAPKLSILAARYLLRHNAHPCDGSVTTSPVNRLTPVPPIFPPLNYADDYDYWRNKDRQEAEEQYCVSFSQ